MIKDRDKSCHKRKRRRSISISDNSWWTIEKYAEQKQSSLSQVIREAIAEKFERERKLEEGFNEFTS